jgi:hypothetical protein
MMHRNQQHTPGGVRSHPVAAAIGSGLAELFDLGLRSPMPERLAMLLDMIDAYERDSAHDAVPKPGGTQAKRHVTSSPR